MANDKTVKKFNELTEEEKKTFLRDKHLVRLKGREKAGSYRWDTEEERANKRRNNEE